MFGLGYLVQGGVKLLGALPRIYKNPSAVWHAIKHQDNFKLGAFLGCFSAVFKVSRFQIDVKNYIHLFYFIIGYTEFML